MRRSFVGLMVAEGISVIGSRMTFVALPWLALVTTGSATKTGVVAFAEMLPYVLASAIGGPLVDRLGARRSSIAMDAASVAVVGGIPLLVHTSGLAFGTLVVLVAVAGTVRGLGDTGKRVLFGRAVAEGNVAMTRATSIHDGLSRLATLIGAPVASILIEITDAPTVLIADAASFGVAAVVVALLVRVTAGEREPETDSYAAQLSEGVAFVKRDKLVLGIMLMLFVTNLLDQAFATVFVPVWANDVFRSPLGLGVTSASFATGAVIGNVIYTALATRLPRYQTFAIGFVIGGAPRFLALGFNAPLWTIVAVGFAAGLGLAAVNPILGAVSYERVPERLIARVMGLSVALSWAGIPLGSLLGGVSADRLGIRWALILGAAGYFMATLLPFTSKVWRQMDAPAAQPPLNAPAAQPADSPAAQPDGQDGQRGHAGGRGAQDRPAEADLATAGLPEGGQLLRSEPALRPDDEDDVAVAR
jgi:MFS family permease